MTVFPFEPGRVVISKAGRDRGRAMVVIAAQDADYVLTVDGDLRKLASPKKKKTKHLHATPVCLEALAKQLQESKALLDADVRKALDQSGYGRNKSNDEEG